MMVDQIDYSRVRALGGKHMQYRFDDYAVDTVCVIVNIIVDISTKYDVRLPRH
jgi:hypothetical protein